MNNILARPEVAIRGISPHFQRSINLTYDAGNEDYIAGYIPTLKGAAALASIFPFNLLSSLFVRINLCIFLTKALLSPR